VGAFDLPEEGDSGDPKVNIRERFIGVMQRERDCPSFTCRVPGFSPKEHTAMIQAEALRAMQREQREADREFQAEQARAARWHNWRTLAVSFVGVAIAAYAAFRAKEPQPPPVASINGIPIAVQPAAPSK
jgi:hypothetical protein